LPELGLVFASDGILDASMALLDDAVEKADATMKLNMNGDEDEEQDDLVQGIAFATLGENGTKPHLMVSFHTGAPVVEIEVESSHDDLLRFCKTTISSQCTKRRLDLLWKTSGPTCHGVHLLSDSERSLPRWSHGDDCLVR